MYLKQIEINGFKSFADKTRMVFEPGMVAIVGPNGCGKSNVSDAIRWVLGEGRPSALRCAKMTDVIFNGAETRKPTGMAEVTITFADCEGVLETEFNEVTISRRVYRSGDGEYFINKVPSRLKDIHRLFMGTGIGTTSYSVLAQGQIDAILSSKPEDRRAVFEEAAGITKFKADRKDALRKIEQTDANLLRLADVIKEVKRQIGTLQRQAGKAQKYKELRDELRGLDLYLTKKRLGELDVRLRMLDTTIQELAGQLEGHQAAVTEAETASAALQEAIHVIEEQIATLTEQAAQADNRYIRAQEVIKVNEQRIEEYQSWKERDSHEISDTQAQMDQVKQQMESLAQKRILLQQADEVGQAKLKETQAAFDAHRAEIEKARAELQKARQDSVDCDRRIAQIQQIQSEKAARSQEQLMKRDRLTSECAQIRESFARAETVEKEVSGRLQTYQEEAGAAEERYETLDAERNESVEELRKLQDETSKLQSEVAAKQAQIDLLTDKRESSDEYAPGAKLLMDVANPLNVDSAAVLGPLADKFNASAELRLPLEAALRAWLDAVVVKDAGAARTLIGALLARGSSAAARLVIAEGAAPEIPATPTGLTPLLSLVQVDDDFAGAAQRLLGRVFLAETLEAVPDPIPAGCSVVTKAGAIFHADGCVELWMPDSQVSSPLARRMLVTDMSEKLTVSEDQLAANKKRLEEIGARASEMARELTQLRQTLDENRRKAAQAEGEYQTVKRDADRVRTRLAEVEKELGTVNAETSGDLAESGALAKELAEKTAMRNALIESTATLSTKVNELEIIYSDLSQKLTECRIQVSSVTQQLEHTAQQGESLQQRMDELDKTMQGRARGVQSYDDSIAKLRAEITKLQNDLEPMRLAAEEMHAKIGATRDMRATKQGELEKQELVLAERRKAMDGVRENKGKAEIEVTESRMKRQNQVDHIFNEYGLSETELNQAPDPEWKKGVIPPVPELESRVKELTDAIQALGPVNLVAIEEYKELEERYSFLKAQETDLQNSRTQILELITQINSKSSEMFQSTFQKANENFEQMFTKLFNGGQAKLVLLENQEDPLECGIDIIARPPGKRPQSVTLLSGGERTMTAVSLLFAIFMIKPAPFCMLDELDAALDDSNIGRFVQALKDFLIHSQFLIITHNQHTIAGSDIVYGVTQQEKGISKIVSMRLRDIGVKELTIGTPPEDKDSAPTVEVEEDSTPPSSASAEKPAGDSKK